MADSPFTRIDPARLRSGWGVKWGSLPQGTIGAWVADMDFGIAAPIRQQLVDWVEREDFGYPFWRGEDPVVTAFQDRMADRYGWRPEPGRTRVFTDLIQVLQVVIEHATAPGDGIALHVPTYPPFLASIARAGRRLVPMPMRCGQDGWGFDGAGLGDRLRAAGCRMMLVVNPHNPTGRVFRRDELRLLADVAEELDLVVLSDEIHADLTYPGQQHIPFAALGADTARRTITATSATKAFNIAALRCAVAHIGAPAVRAALDKAPLDYFGTPSTLSRVATVAAWRDADSWLDELMRTLTRNRDTVTDWIAAMLPDSRYHPAEGTYLAWFDLPGWRPSGSGPAAHLARVAEVALSEGAEFSAGTTVDTTPFVRLNFATSPDNLDVVLDRISAGLRSGLAGSVR
ncbi:MalY/PatB family protein [Goodfellowiella coeruleoviolacea]|uniref:cysteine-S-conjugate beta-lyase n=1 Tax=Goodfellowiella coeruleoviolacea TaxID=334858 RepID=A0AAE3GHM4_9PSEU|nr:aminotransferase class I/II-fold pyridoxal phosphate-dependent enzyme [Goodfellowiella coeruleoviolacea]MCP2167459.1 cystathione beta-lyase [Goodfellowiella coeruleoviolacea]